MNGHIDHNRGPSFGGEEPARLQQRLQNDAPNGRVSPMAVEEEDERLHPRRPRPDPRVKQMRTLSTVDVASLIANKMIGTGIFTGPSVVLQYTLNKNLAIGLWTLGLVYTLLSMMLYIEYARKLPFTGGELVYMDDALPKPRLLAYTSYAFYFVFIYTSCANSMNFARFVLAASNTDYFNYTPRAPGKTSLNDHQSLVRFMAVVAITAVCLLLYVSNAKSKLVNRLTAGAKILLLLVVIFAGAAYIGKRQASGELSGSESQWSFTAADVDGQRSWPLALITCLFSYHGWENATLVAGEVDSFKVLRRGFLLAVFGVGTLYLSMAILLNAAFDWVADGSKYDVPAIPMSLYFGGAEDNTGTGAVAAAVLISLSAFGSILSVSYTCVRVKQSIGWSNILPWSHIWRRQGPIHPVYEWQVDDNGHNELIYTFPERALNRPGTPEGGIILHWITTTSYICATAAFGNIQDAVSFAGNVLVYGHFFAEAAVAILFLPIGSFGFDPYSVKYFPAWNWHANQTADEQAGYPPQWLRPSKAHWLGPLILGGLVFVFSFMIIGAALVGWSGQLLITVVLGILGAGGLYWFLFIRYKSARKVYAFFGFSLKKAVHGVDDVNDPQRACDWCAVIGEAHRHPTESYQSYNQIALNSDAFIPRLLHWIFHGSSGNRPWLHRNPMWQSVWDCLGSRGANSERWQLGRRS